MKLELPHVTRSLALALVLVSLPAAAEECPQKPADLLRKTTGNGALAFDAPDTEAILVARISRLVHRPRKIEDEKFDAAVVRTVCGPVDYGRIRVTTYLRLVSASEKPPAGREIVVVVRRGHLRRAKGGPAELERPYLFEVASGEPRWRRFVDRVCQGIACGPTAKFQEVETGFRRCSELQVPEDGPCQEIGERCVIQPPAMALPGGCARGGVWLICSVAPDPRIPCGPVP